MFGRPTDRWQKIQFVYVLIRAFDGKAPNWKDSSRIMDTEGRAVVYPWYPTNADKCPA